MITQKAKSFLLHWEHRDYADNIVCRKVTYLYKFKINVIKCVVLTPIFEK